MTWFVLSLIAILFWSGSDLFSKMGSKPDDKYSHWKMVMAVGAVMGLHAIIMLALGTPFHPRDIITYMPASAMYILSMVLGYVGLRYIELSISSPICNSSGAVAALLCFLFLGQRMTGLQLRRRVGAGRHRAQTGRKRAPCAAPGVECEVRAQHHCHSVSHFVLPD